MEDKTIAINASLKPGRGRLQSPFIREAEASPTQSQFDRLVLSTPSILRELHEGRVSQRADRR